MDLRLTKRFTQGSIWAAVIVLGCSVAIAQQPDLTSAPKSVPVLSGRSQLPDNPAPTNVAPLVPAVPSAPAAAVERPEPSSSSSSTSVPTTPPAYWTGAPNAHVTVLENTLLRVMTNSPLSSDKTRAGSRVLLTLSEDVVVNNVLIIPRGANLHGTVVQSKKAGTLKGRSADLILELNSLDLAGRTYPLYTYQFKVQGASKNKPTDDMVVGAYYGALAGAVVNAETRGASTPAQTAGALGAGAAVGAGIGTLAAAATPGPPVDLPAESQMDFYLAAPISVVPVSAQEAARLSHKLPEGGPVLYVRGETP